MACHTQLGGVSEETDEDEDEIPEAQQQQQQQQLPADDALATKQGDVTNATNESDGLKTNHGDAILSDQNQSAGLKQFR